MIETAKKIGGDLLRNIEITDVYEADGKRALLFSMTYQAKDRTLSTDEVNQLHSKIGEALKKDFGVEIKGKENLESKVEHAEAKIEEITPAQTFQPQENVVVGRILKL